MLSTIRAFFPVSAFAVSDLNSAVYADMRLIASFLKQNQTNTLTAMKLLVFCMMCSRPIVMIKESPSYYFGLYGLANGTILILFHLGVFLPLCAFILWILELIK